MEACPYCGWPVDPEHTPWCPDCGNRMPWPTEEIVGDLVVVLALVTLMLAGALVWFVMAQGWL